ncbi:hypothetical protein ANCDUO_02244 [Ancylostoma duodenale]|uniref:DNA helicase Pif1-like 2B domain-containing protein n=1 Tax=Ancylostoma duodenale TaxID=51022 RepID=A0A0C2H104_9BILA|nr:hypothetical protein ANCDUO_02244 [Ancylostoma duodenale]
MGVFGAKNVHAEKLNEEALQRLCIFRAEEERVHKSVDEAQYPKGDSGELYPTEYLDALKPTRMPPHELHLEKGAIVMLVRNIEVVRGLCNGMRLMLETIGRHVHGCRFLCGNRDIRLAITPRIDNY